MAKEPELTAAAAIDWSKVDWTKVLAVVQQILDALRKQPKKAEAGKGHCEHDCCLYTLSCSMETTRAALEHYLHCCHHDDH